MENLIGRGVGAPLLVVLAMWICMPSDVSARPARAAHAAARCCKVPAGTRVEVELAEAVSTKVRKTGDTVPLRLAAPLVVSGRVVMRKGAMGEGEVVEATRPGLGGKASKLVLDARFLEQDGVRVPLQGLQLAAAGRNNTRTAAAVGLTGLAFAPLGFVGFAVTGGDATFPAGTEATATVATDVTLPSLGRAAPAKAAPPMAVTETADQGSITIPPPPPGKGEVVFFRPKTILGTGKWFKVREGGQALGKLSNGVYFVQVTDPGRHTYTAALEPEMKDHLTLNVGPGQVFFVEGVMSKGLILGFADLQPSTRADFDRASRHLLPAWTPNGTDDSAEAGTAREDAAAGAPAPPPPK